MLALCSKLFSNIAYYSHALSSLFGNPRFLHTDILSVGLRLCSSTAATSLAMGGLTNTIMRFGLISPVNAGLEIVIPRYHNLNLKGAYLRSLPRQVLQLEGILGQRASRNQGHVRRLKESADRVPVS